MRLARPYARWRWVRLYSDAVSELKGVRRRFVRDRRLFDARSQQRAQSSLGRGVRGERRAALVGHVRGEANRSWGHINALSTLPDGSLLVTGGRHRKHHGGVAVPLGHRWRAGLFQDLRWARPGRPRARAHAGRRATRLWAHEVVQREHALARKRSLWVVRTSVDGRVTFGDDSEMKLFNTAARFRRSDSPPPGPPVTSRARSRSAPRPSRSPPSARATSS